MNLTISCGYLVLVYTSKKLALWAVFHKNVCFEDICCRFYNKSEHVIRSKCFFSSTIFDIFSITHIEEEVWPDGTHPMLFTVK